MDKEWVMLINIFEKHEAYCDFIAECIYAWLTENGDNPEMDKNFMCDLLDFMGMVREYNND